MNLVLTLLSGHRAGERIAVNSEVYRIGRGSDNELAFGRFDHVSTHHAELRLEAGVWFFQDLNSTNGSAVRRSGDGGFEDLRKLHRPPVELGDGDEIHLGDPAAPLRLAVAMNDDLHREVLHEQSISARHLRQTVRADPADPPARRSQPADLAARPSVRPQTKPFGGDSMRPSAQAPLVRADGELMPLEEAMRIFEHLQINEALHRAGGDLMRAAGLLQVGPVELQQRLDKLRGS